MSRLADFTSKDFIEQISVLNAMVENKEFDSIPGLISLMETIPVSDAVGLVIRDTLKSLLSASEECTAGCFASGNREVRTMCIEVAGQRRFASAASAIRDMAGQAAAENDHGMLFIILSSLAQLDPQGSLDLFRKHLGHEDPSIASLCIRMTGVLADAASFDCLCRIVVEAGSDENYEECSLETASAIESLGEFKSEKAVRFLVSQIHHRNPAARRLIHHELVEIGNDAVKPLSVIFSEADPDRKVLAANVLGLIGTREAGNVLVAAMDKGLAGDLNIRFAVYDALGRIPGMKSLVCLTDGLQERDEMVLTAVVSSLGKQYNPWIIDRIIEFMGKDSPHGQALTRAIIASRSLDIFEALYLADETIGSRLVGEIVRTGDRELADVFQERLKKMNTGRSQADISLLKGVSTPEKKIRVLAVDDSRAMLNFYSSILSETGIGLATACNGKDALDLLLAGDEYHLVITDMNMPVMDGIELTRQMRSQPALAGIPVVMVTTESGHSQEGLARKAGVTAFLRKPFSAEKLRKMIETCRKP